MPLSPPRICQKHKKPFTESRCPICTEEWKQALKDSDNRESSYRRGYDRQWQKVRTIKLSNDPYCERCKSNHRIVPAVMVHHKDRDSKNNRYENLESICRSCHNEEHKEEVFGHGK